MTNKELFKLYEELKERMENFEAGRMNRTKDLYTVKEVAEILNLSTEGVYKLIRKGQLPTIKLGTTKIRACDLKEIMGTNH